VAADPIRPPSASVCQATAVAGPFRLHVTFLGYTPWLMLALSILL